MNQQFVQKQASLAPVVGAAEDIFTGFRMVPECLSRLVAPAAKVDQVNASEKKAPIEASKASPLGYLTEYGFFGLKGLTATAIYGIGLFNGWTYSAAFVTGAVACWAIKGAITPFLGKDSWNPVQLGYSGVSKAVAGGKFVLAKTLDSDVGRVLMYGDGFLLRMGTASVLSFGAWVSGNPLVTAVAGAIAYRACKRFFFREK